MNWKEMKSKILSNSILLEKLKKFPNRKFIQKCQQKLDAYKKPKPNPLDWFNYFVDYIENTDSNIIKRVIADNKEKQENERELTYNKIDAEEITLNT